MNKINFLQRVGFPMDVNVLDEMQTSYKLLNGLGALAGDLSIIKGCDISGNTISDGIVYINGEVLEFRSGVVSENVIIVEEPQTSEFENTEIHEILYIRYATFGVATTSYPWASFKRAFPTREIAGALANKVDSGVMQAILNRIATLEAKSAVFQAGGGMVLWNKPASQIPTGWAEVVDWRGRMPVGWNPNDGDFQSLGEIGGSKNHILTIDEMPAHSHNTTYGTEDANSSGSTRTWLQSGSGTAVKTSTSVGGNQSFNIMNPYRVVLFIEYVEQHD